jgi:hypothetical protein
MNMPGFTAEVSAYKSIKFYTAGFTSGKGKISDIYPSAWMWMRSMQPPVRKPPGGGNGTGPDPICFGLCTLICVYVDRPIDSCIRDCKHICEERTA